MVFMRITVRIYSAEPARGGWRRMQEGSGDTARRDRAYGK